MAKVQHKKSKAKQSTTKQWQEALARLSPTDEQTTQFNEMCRFPMPKAQAIALSQTKQAREDWILIVRAAGVIYLPDSCEGLKQLFAQASQIFASVTKSEKSVLEAANSFKAQRRFRQWNGGVTKSEALALLAGEITIQHLRLKYLRSEKKVTNTKSTVCKCKTHSSQRTQTESQHSCRPLGTTVFSLYETCVCQCVSL